MANTKGPLHLLALLGAWVGTGGSALLAILIWWLPDFFNRGAEQFTGAPVNTDAGGLTARFVEKQVAVFWWAVAFVALLAIGFVVAAWAHSSRVRARSIAAGDGDRPLILLLVAALLVASCAIFASLPRAIFDPVDSDRLQFVSPLAAFAQESPATGWLFGALCALACGGLAWLLGHFGWVPWLAPLGARPVSPDRRQIQRLVQ